MTPVLILYLLLWALISTIIVITVGSFISNQLFRRTNLSLLMGELITTIVTLFIVVLPAMILGVYIVIGVWLK